MGFGLAQSCHRGGTLRLQRLPQAGAQNKPGAHQRPKRRSQRIEGLRQRQPAVCAALRSQNRDEGICGDLKHGDACRHHEKREQETRIGAQRGRRRKQQAADSHHNQPLNDGANITDPRQYARREQRKNEIPQEEAELREHRFGIAQGEQALEFWNQRIDQDGGKPPREKQEGDQIGHARRCRTLGRGCVCSCRCIHCSVSLCRCLSRMHHVTGARKR